MQDLQEAPPTPASYAVMMSPLGPDQADVDALRDLLDLIEDFASNDQKARYLLSCNWMRERGAQAAQNNAVNLAYTRARLGHTGPVSTP